MGLGQAFNARCQQPETEAKETSASSLARGLEPPVSGATSPTFRRTVRQIAMVELILFSQSETRTMVWSHCKTVFKVRPQHAEWV